MCRNCFPIALFHLLPFSLQELEAAGRLGRFQEISKHLARPWLVYGAINNRQSIFTFCDPDMRKIGRNNICYRPNRGGDVGTALKGR